MDKGACLLLLIAAGIDLEAHDKADRTAASLASDSADPRLASLLYEIILSRKEAAQAAQLDLELPSSSHGQAPGRPAPRI